MGERARGARILGEQAKEEARERAKEVGVTVRRWV